MYRQHSEVPVRVGAALLVGVLLIGGCAATPSAPKKPTGSGGPDSERVEPPPANPARVEVDEGVGFTVTEVAALGSDARTTYRAALQRLAEGDLQGGIALLEEVVEEAPEATAPYIDLGIAHSRAGDYDAAVESFQSALAMTPNHPVAHNELGIAYRRLGRFEEARASYEHALAVFPGFHYARRNLAVLCDLYLADLDCALEQYTLYQDAVVDDPDVDIWVGDLKNRMYIAHQEAP